MGTAGTVWGALHHANSWDLCIYGGQNMFIYVVVDNVGSAGAVGEALHPPNSWGLSLHGQLEIFNREAHQTRCKKKIALLL